MVQGRALEVGSNSRVWVAVLGEDQGALLAFVWPFRRVRVSYLDCWKRPSLFNVTSSPFPFFGGASLLRFKGKGLPEFLPAPLCLDFEYRYFIIQVPRAVVYPKDT
jgi:hypothetical protein